MKNIFAIFLLISFFSGFSQNSKTLEKAKKFAESQDFEKAIKLYSKILNNYPDNYLALSRRAQCHRKLGHYQEAISDARWAIQLDSNNAFAYKELAAVYAISDNLQKGLEYANKAIECDPDNSSAFTARGAIYYLMSDYEAAINDYLSSLQLDPENGVIYHNIGILFRLAGKYDQALEMLNQALFYEPTNHKNLFEQGLTLFEWKKYQQAIIGFEDALTYNYRVDPYEQIDNGRIYYLKGVANYHTNNSQQACEDLTIAYNLGYDNARYYMDSLSCSTLELTEDQVSSVESMVLKPQNLKVFPNPFVHQVTFEIKASNLGMEIFNSQGQLVYSKENFNNSLTIRKNSYMKKGVFIYVIRENDFVIKTGKIIAQ